MMSYRNLQLVFVTLLCTASVCKGKPRSTLERISANKACVKNCGEGFATYR